MHLNLFRPYPVEVHCRRGDDDFGSDHDGWKTSRHGSVGPAVDGTAFRHAPPPDAADGRKSGSRLADIAVTRVVQVALCEAMETSCEDLLVVRRRVFARRHFAPLTIGRNKGRQLLVVRSMADEPQLQVVYDAECSLCQAARSWVERRDAQGCILFQPANSNIPSESRVLTVHDGIGDRPGFDGWVTILEQLPRWRRLAPALAWKPVRRVGSAIYAVVAAHRHGFVRN